MKSNRVILYCNSVTKQSIWIGNDRIYISHSDDSYESMTMSHELIRQMNKEECKDMVEAINLLLKIHGVKS